MNGPRRDARGRARYAGKHVLLVGIAWQIFLRVMLPLTTSGLGFLAVHTFLQDWNDFLVPSYMPGRDDRPLTLGLHLVAGGRSFDIGPLAAGTLITILPVVLLFVVLQRQVTEGFSGAVKG